MSEKQTGYFIESGVLMRSWSPVSSIGHCDEVHQIVVPTPYRALVLSLAHDHPLSGHVLFPFISFMYPYKTESGAINPLNGQGPPACRG